jgi:hypothetical protein
MRALMNSMGSLGLTFRFVVSAQKFSYNGACALNLGMFVIRVPSLGWVAYIQVKDTTHMSSLSSGSSTGSVLEIGGEAEAERQVIDIKAEV